MKKREGLYTSKIMICPLLLDFSHIIIYLVFSFVGDLFENSHVLRPYHKAWFLFIHVLSRISLSS